MKIGANPCPDHAGQDSHADHTRIGDRPSIAPVNDNCGQTQPSGKGTTGPADQVTLGASREPGSATYDLRTIRQALAEALADSRPAAQIRSDSPQRLDLVKARIAANYYDRLAVKEAVAERLADVLKSLDSAED